MSRNVNFYIHQHNLIAENQCSSSVSNSDDNVKFVRSVTPKELFSLDIESDDLPFEDSIVALDAAALRLRAIAQRLLKQDIPINILEKNLKYASSVLDKLIEKKLRQLTKKDVCLLVPQNSNLPDEVLRWLHLTFSEAEIQFSTIFPQRHSHVQRMQTVSISMTGSNISKALSGMKTEDSWDFDVFAFASVCEKKPLKMLVFNIMNQYGIISKFQVPGDVLNNFLVHVEDSYHFNNNPYHNNLHAADSVQTLHYMLLQTGVIDIISDLEAFACVLSAFVHDYKHPGMNNAFQVNTGSKLALLYNDRSVLEMYHASAVFTVLQKKEFNILQNVSAEDYKKLRYLVIEFILATDINCHAQFFKEMKDTVSLPLFLIDKVKALSFLILCSDISHPAKNWELHSRWTNRCFDELWIQGDREKSLGLPISPMCNRRNTNIALCQIGLLENIIQPTFELLNRVLAGLLEYPACAPLAQGHHSGTVRDSLTHFSQMPWKANILTNLQNWKKKCKVS